MKKVLIIGASKKPERYSYMAMQRLEEAKHPILLFNPGLHEIEGREVIQDLSTIQETIDTVTCSPKNVQHRVIVLLHLQTENTYEKQNRQTLYRSSNNQCFRAS